MKKITASFLVSILILFGVFGYYFEAQAADPLITAVYSSDVTSSSARISWTTDIPATTGMKYWQTSLGMQSGYYVGEDCMGSGQFTIHCVNLTGLIPGTSYSYWVESLDQASGGYSQYPPSDNYPSFVTTASVGGVINITQVYSTTLSTSTQQISWDTDELSDSSIEYGMTSGTYPNSNFTRCDGGGYVLDHCVTIGPLVSGSTYYFRVKSINITVNKQGISSEFSFTIQATASLTISSVSHSLPSQSTAQIIWTTNEASNSSIRYGTISGTYPILTYTRCDGGGYVTSHCVNISSLNPGATYYYVVQSVDATLIKQATSSEYSFTVPTTLPPAPPMPTNFYATVTSTTERIITLTWSDVSNEDSYKIYEKVDQATSFTLFSTLSANTTMRTYTYEARTAAYPIEFRLQACNMGGCSSYISRIVSVPASTVYSGTGASETPTTNPVPPTPTGLTAYASTIAPEVKLTWQDNSSYETEFRIYHRWSAALTPFAFVGTVPQNTVTFKFGYSGITAATNAEFRIEACNSTGCSIPSSNIGVVVQPISSLPTSTEDSTSTTITAITPPAPAGLGGVLTSIPNRTISLSWQDYSNLETEYRLFVRVGSTTSTATTVYSWNIAKVLPANSIAHTFIHPIVAAAMTFDFKLQACNGPYCSGDSNVVSVAVPVSTTTTTTPLTIPPVPTGLKANLIATTSRDINLNWFDFSTLESEFKVYYRPNSSTTSTTLTTQADWMLLGTSPANTPYYVYKTPSTMTASGIDFKVAACNSAGCSPDSMSVFVFLPSATTVTVGTKTVTGTILFDDGKPVTDAEAGAMSTLTNAWVYGYSDSAGKYTIPGLITGTYKIGIRPKNPATSTWYLSKIFDEVAFDDSGTSELKEINYIVTRSLATVTVRVANVAGEAVGNVFVNVDGALVSGRKADATGTVVFQLPRGNYTLRAYPETTLNYFNPEPIAFSLIGTEQKEIVIVLQARVIENLKTINGIVKFDGGAGTDAFVWGWSDRGENISLRSDAAGKFTIKSKPLSVWRVGANKTAADGVYKAAEISVFMQDVDVVADLVLVKQAIVLSPPVVQTASSTTSITAQSTDGAQVVVPANVTQVTGQVTVGISPTVEAPVQAAKQPVSTVYDVTITDAGGTSVTSLSDVIEISLPYNEVDISGYGVSEDALLASYYDEASGAWIQVSDFSVDTLNNVVVARVDHLTRFAVVMPADTTPPLPPSSVSVSKAASGGVLLSWTNPDKDFKYVKIYRSESKDSIGTLMQNNYTASTYTDTAAVLGTTYYYTIHSVDPAGNESANTDTVSFAYSSSNTSQQSTTVSGALTRDLKYGMRGNDVKALQDLLKKQGVFSTRVRSTGYFGTITKAAVIKLQNKYPSETFTFDGLTKANGVVSGNTKVKINQLIGQ